MSKGATMLGGKSGAPRKRSSSFVVNDATNVRVMVRVRPFNNRERESGQIKTAVMLEGKQAYMIDIETGQPKDERFVFDNCFWSNTDIQSSNGFTDQAGVYEEVGSALLENAFKGYHSCLFAYGQTGAGKSFTMMGDRTKPDMWGMIPRLCGGLFQKIDEEAKSGKEFKVEVAYIEIYNELLKDLLGTSNGFSDVKIRDHPIYGPSVEGNKLGACKNLNDINSIMDKGDHRRTVAATSMNATSSRSHAVFTVMFSQSLTEGGKKQQWFSKINLIDLAGSERVEDSGVSGINFKEAVNINKSLTTLGRVMDALVELSQGKKGIIPPYRDSMLTRMLQDSLGGNSKTMMFANVSPSALNYEETLSTLRYSSRARQIVNMAKVNTVATGGAELPPPPPQEPVENPRCAELEEEKKLLEEQLAREKAEWESNRDRLQQEAERAANEKQRAESEKMNMAQAKQQVEREKAEMEQQKSQVLQEKGKLEKEKQSLESDKSGLLQEKAGLEKEKRGLESDKSNLLSDKQRLEREKAELEQEKRALLDDKAKLERDRSNLGSDLTNMRKERDDYLEELERLRQRARKQEGDIQQLERKVETERKKASDYLMNLASIEESVTRMGIRVPGPLV